MSWAINKGLAINPQNVAVVPFARRRKLESLARLTLHDEEFVVLEEVRYIGVMLDFRLSWNSHITKITNKAISTFAVISRLLYKT